MGHIHLGTLPKTKNWQAVVGMLADSEATPHDIFAASAKAAERDLNNAANDPGFVDAVHLLLNLPLAARHADFTGGLLDLDIQAGSAPDLMSITAGIGRRLDAMLIEQGHRGDFGELARRALISTLNTQIGDRLPGLFEATPAEVQAAFAHFSSPKPFAQLARSFFSSLVRESLSYWLDRDLARHIGPNARFTNLGARSEFDASLGQYAMESSRIMQEFAAGWQSKALRDAVTLTRDDTTRFGAFTLKKIVSELQIKRDSHD